MIYTQEQIKELIIPMLKSMEGDYDAVADEIIKLTFSNFLAGVDQAMRETAKHFGLEYVEGSNAKIS